jgi:hypothetical protein
MEICIITATDAAGMMEDIVDWTLEMTMEIFSCLTS